VLLLLLLLYWLLLLFSARYNLTMTSTAFCPNLNISIIGLTYGNAHTILHCLRMSMLPWNKTLYLECSSRTFIDWVFIMFSIDVCLTSSFSMFSLHIVSHVWLSCVITTMSNWGGKLLVTGGWSITNAMCQTIKIHEEFKKVK